MRFREAFLRAQDEPGAWTASEFRVLEMDDRPSGRRIWTGRNSSGLLTAFFESGDDRTFSSEVSQAIRITSASITNEAGDSLRAVQVQCLEPRLGEVFDTFLQDVVSAIERGLDVVDALVETASVWRRLLAVAREGITETALRGLFGELVVLRDLTAQIGPQALDLWRGPDGGRHDFVGSSASVEVKTASLQNRQAITVHGLRQLDPPESASLYLAVAEVDPHPQGELVTEVLDDIVLNGVDQEVLRDKLANLGYVPGMPGTEGVRFTLVSLKCWEIDDDTPILRRSALPERIVHGVSDLSYSLDLAVLGPDFATRIDVGLLTAGAGDAP